MDCKQILVDAREFIGGKNTGIGRFLEGLVDCLAETFASDNIVLLSLDEKEIPTTLREKVNVVYRRISGAFLKSEIILSNLTRWGADLCISPYPKLPLFGTFCPSVNTIHDVLDLTHPAYKKRSKVFFDRFRIKAALKSADLTWYVSKSSLKATDAVLGLVGRKPRVRYPALDGAFNPASRENTDALLDKYHLSSGYILVIGNGLPHKNLGVLLKISERLTRKPVFIGIPSPNMKFWQKKYPRADAVWINHVTDPDLPVIIGNAYCLAQPSTAEGYGYPPLEAMACGVPAVVSNIPVLVESTGGNALIADPHSADTWLESFLMLENEQKYRTQVVNGLKWVGPLKSPQGWSKHLSDIEQLLEAKKSIET
ncbi:MAG: glycosyltransferase family 4 protein [Planctomycetota bacterium]|jgi:glycosyltransferase involved in cell wall biosynthesis